MPRKMDHAVRGQKIVTDSAPDRSTVKAPDEARYGKMMKGSPSDLSHYTDVNKSSRPGPKGGTR